MVAAGTGLIALGVLGRKFMNIYRDMDRLRKITGKSALTFYHPGGFMPKMDRREAALILNVRETASKEAVKDAHRKIMIANHPDKGGSPFLAMKINEAKSILESKS